MIVLQTSDAAACCDGQVQQTLSLPLLSDGDVWKGGTFPELKETCPKVPEKYQGGNILFADVGILPSVTILDNPSGTHPKAPVSSPGRTTLCNDNC
jgi:hypothetical protein